ncbi:unnamed protein product [Brassica oleracea var. botrytis]
MEKRRREEIETAAQELMQLSDEEISFKIIKKKKIEELFGEDDTHEDQCTKEMEMVIVRVTSSSKKWKKKEKKFRTLESIYMATRPIRGS